MLGCQPVVFATVRRRRPCWILKSSRFSRGNAQKVLPLGAPFSTPTSSGNDFCDSSHKSDSAHPTSTTKFHNALTTLFTPLSYIVAFALFVLYGNETTLRNLRKISATETRVAGGCVGRDSHPRHLRRGYFTSTARCGATSTRSRSPATLATGKSWPYASSRETQALRSVLRLQLFCVTTVTE